MLNLIMEIKNEYENSLKEGKTCIIICGPTASGKSGFGISLARELDGEIISCDSMQIYRHMDIGTAKTSPEEMQGIRHHMIDVAEPWETYSVYKYREQALEIAGEIMSGGKVPVFVGGTGLYVNSLIDNRQFAETDTDMPQNNELLLRAKKLAEENKTEELYAILKVLDNTAAENIHPNNIKRVYRAIELCVSDSGKSARQRNEESLKKGSEIKWLTYCLLPERQTLYEKINLRVDQMVNEGLLSETEKIYKMCREKFQGEDIFSLTSLYAIGYRELLPLLDYEETKRLKLTDFDENYDLTAAVEKIKTDTRHYAKRQVTWFKKTPGVRFICGGEITDEPIW